MRTLTGYGIKSDGLLCSSHLQDCSVTVGIEIRGIGVVQFPIQFQTEQEALSANDFLCDNLNRSWISLIISEDYQNSAVPVKFYNAGIIQNYTAGWNRLIMIPVLLTNQN